MTIFKSKVKISSNGLGNCLSNSLYCSIGLEFGLSLTLNVEQYEYITGPSTDAGIQVKSTHRLMAYSGLRSRPVTLGTRSA